MPSPHSVTTSFGDNCCNNNNGRFLKRVNSNEHNVFHNSCIQSKSVEFSSVSWLIGLSGGHEGWFSRNPCTFWVASVWHIKSTTRYSYITINMHSKYHNVKKKKKSKGTAWVTEYKINNYGNIKMSEFKNDLTSHYCTHFAIHTEH